jgi:sugar-specific transcriptional regulator TrmB
MNEQLISHIEDLGLSNKEARVYVACLMTGPAAVQRIADQAGIKRVTAYVILESLVGLGLVSQSVKGKKTLFIAEEPTNLRRLLDKRAQELKDQQSNFESILPELAGLKTLPAESPDIKFYDSADGIKSLFSTFYTEHGHEVDRVHGISNVDQLHSFFPEIAKANANPERVKNKVPSRIIYSTTRGPILHDGDKAANRESRFVPLDKYPLNGDINIVGPYVILVSFTGPRPLGLSIHSQEIADGMRAFFDVAWDNAARYNE